MVREAIDRIHRDYIYPHLISGSAQQDREVAHERALDLMERRFEHNPLLFLLSRVFTYEDPRLATVVFGKFFSNPLGIAAGFDKNGRVFNTLGALGFGFIEVGSITTRAYEGNLRPRVFPLPEDNGLINRMGFPGDGLQRCKWRLVNNLPARQDRHYGLGVNIGASRPSFDENTVIEDISFAHESLSGIGDYVVDNISSPNTQGVRGLQEPEVLDRLLSATDRYHRRDSLGRVVDPRLVKLSPDLNGLQLAAILDVVCRHNVDGVVLTNTSTNKLIKDNLKGIYRGEVGGVSGAPLTDRALEVSRFVYEQTGGKLPIIRAGGVMTPKDYWEAVVYGGASLVQVYTALVNEKTSTPSLAYYFNQEFVQRMERVGATKLEEIRGEAKSKDSFRLIHGMHNG